MAPNNRKEGDVWKAPPPTSLRASQTVRGESLPCRVGGHRNAWTGHDDLWPESTSLFLTNTLVSPLGPWGRALSHIVFKSATTKLSGCSVPMANSGRQGDEGNRSRRRRGSRGLPQEEGFSEAWGATSSHGHPGCQLPPSGLSLTASTSSTPSLTG